LSKQSEQRKYGDFQPHHLKESFSLTSAKILGRASFCILLAVLFQQKSARILQVLFVLPKIKFKKVNFYIDIEFMIIPMIDIIFFLLVFFMMNSLQTVAQKALDVQLPQAQTATAPVQLPIIMTLDADGHITIDNNPMSITESAAIMKRHMEENPNAAVVLQADQRTAHGQVVAVMDMLKGAGVKRLSIAAEQKG